MAGVMGGEVDRREQQARTNTRCVLCPVAVDGCSNVGVYDCGVQMSMQGVIGAVGQLSNSVFTERC